eukprot:CAMPEP_0114508426 /NCGR_PEP_ID=MMETSP0109-20121206/12594_1 /TAXON_ID=29199 /ORGANISM="Chlorarachnion reptans, Strain CCCM449" /LENGTH=335 /DNA_ID=CAMNT_0001687359 /DNA_START=406 /DNA_END=1413 /DNA_ORIENTATION=+
MKAKEEGKVEGGDSSEMKSGIEKQRKGKTAIWKFGYGSNMSQDFLRTKKQLRPLDYKRVVLKGFSLSFPEGKGIDFVEPSFATLKRNPKGEVHGIATLLGLECARKLDAQEGAYNVEVHSVEEYSDGKGGAEGETKTLLTEVYTPRREIPLSFPEGCCSDRYRDVLVKGAIECKLSNAWVEKLRKLPVYNPTEETLKMRASVPPVSSFKPMSIAELRKHDGSVEGKPIYVSSCGFIFDLTPAFKVYRGRDVTKRHILHRRGVNLDANDDGGVSPFPRLTKVEPGELEYALRYRDRYMHKAKAKGQNGPVAVLREFWEEQDESLKGVFEGNTFSKL